jgi:hypothetical protein
MMVLLAIVFTLLVTHCQQQQQEQKAEKIGVLYLIHGGMDTHKPQYMWDAAVLQFSFDHNHPVNKFVIWNSKNWPLVLDTHVSDFTLKYLRMYEFEFERIGGTDPYHSLSEKQLADVRAELDANPYGLTFEVDWAGYQCADRLEHYPYPRFIYYGPDGPDKGVNCTYCGEKEPDGPWPDCDPERYNVDGPVERLLKKGVSRIIMVDLNTGGVRYSRNSTHGTSVPFLWINDYSRLMERSYPVEPAGWTASLGLPTVDSQVLINGCPNPISSDPELATLNVEAIEAGMSSAVSDANTGILLLNHSLNYDNNEVFDPKINDTLILNKNIKSQLLERHPDMDPKNIIGAYLGKREKNPENGLVEHTRVMRAEVYGYAWLYESNKELPGEEWGYRCWDGLEYLKDRGVKHIVIINPQINTASVLDLVEMPNQIGREIGIKTWAKWETGDLKRYPGVGHPFADYWGMWVYTDCGEWQLKYEGGTYKFTGGMTFTGQDSGAKGVIKWLTGDVTSGTLILKEVSGTFQDGEIITGKKGGSARAAGSAVMTSKRECCFEMGGCGDPLRPYPPPRQTPLNKARSDLDPSVAYDMSDYGHLGYDPAKGPPDSNKPVQNQYTGTWAMYTPSSDNPRVGKLVAKHVLNAALNPMVYITNGEISGIRVGESVTFEAHVTGGSIPAVTYQWSIKKEGSDKWVSAGSQNANWTWTPADGDTSTYDIRCRVTDARNHTGEVIWEGFVVSEV